METMKYFETFIGELFDNFPCHIISTRTSNVCLQKVFYLLTYCLHFARDFVRNRSILVTLRVGWLCPLSFVPTTVCMLNMLNTVV